MPKYEISVSVLCDHHIVVSADNKGQAKYEAEVMAMKEVHKTLELSIHESKIHGQIINDDDPRPSYSISKDNWIDE